jgi:uracil-DNA glycosylase
MNIKTLFTQLESTIPSENVYEQSGMIKKSNCLTSGFAFFPLGTGIIGGAADILDGGIMILGNDFGTEEYLDKIHPLGKEDEAKQKTIVNLNNILSSCKIEKSDCFFTNYYMGVRKVVSIDKKKVTNTKRGISIKEEYKLGNKKFFEIQLKAFNPRLVIVMGAEVARALYDFDNIIFANWGKSMISLKKMYAEGNGVCIKRNDVTFVLISHPSFANSNGGQIIKDNKTRSQMEIAALKLALKK